MDHVKISHIVAHKISEPHVTVFSHTQIQTCHHAQHCTSAAAVKCFPGKLCDTMVGVQTVTSASLTCNFTFQNIHLIPMQSDEIMLCLT
jgi:hypothetical protein